MINSLRFLQPIRASLAAVISPSSQLSHPKFSLNGQLKPLKTWMKALKAEEHDFFRHSRWKFNLRQCHYQCRRASGGKVILGSIFGISAVIFSLRHQPRVAYCTEGHGFYEDNSRLSSPGDSDTEEDARALLALLRKLLVPVFLFLTVVTNWGHPMLIGAKVTLVLLSTKPSPASVYLFVEQLRHQEVRKHSFLYRVQSYLQKVDVEDYTLLCVAGVEFVDKRYTLIGILGSWWVFPVSSWQEAKSMLTNTVRKHIN